MGTTRPFGAIRKLPSGRFQARYLHLGRRLSADTTFATKAEARNFLAGIETDLTRGTYVDPDAGRITFGEYAGWWLEQRQLRPRTRESYESQLKHILTTFEGGSVQNLHPTLDDPLVDFGGIEADEFAQLAERNPALVHQPPDEPRTHAEPLRHLGDIEKWSGR